MALGWLWWHSVARFGRAWARLVAGYAAQLCVAGVALGDIFLGFAWQAWHWATSIFVSRGKRGTYGIGLALVARLGALGRRWRRSTLRGMRGTWRQKSSFRVASVALGDIYLRFAWQAWHLATSTLVWHGRRGAWWQHVTATFVLHGRRVALRDIHLRFAWQAWHLWHWAGSGGALGRAWARLVCRWRRSTLRGRSGTWRHPPSFRVTGMALGDIHPRFAWQAWRCALGGAFGRRWLRGALGGRRGTWRHLSSFCVASVALGDIYLCFAWQAWHLLHLVARLGALGRRWRQVAGVALGDIHLRSTWQACHLVTSTFVLRARRGTYGTGLAFTHHFVTHHLWHTIFHTTLSHTIFHTPLCHTPSFTHNFLTSSLSHTPSFTHNFVTHHLSHTQLCHTPSFSTPSFTHHFVTHHLSHTTFSQALFHTRHLLHTTLSHHLSHTHNFVTHHLSPHHLSDTTLSHTIFHTQLSHTLSFTHKFFTRHLSHTTLSHTHTHHLSLSHTIFHTQLCDTQLCFTSRSSTTSFVFPSFPVPATTFGAHYWKKLPCGVIRSFNLGTDQIWSLGMLRRTPSLYPGEARSNFGGWHLS